MLSFNAIRRDAILEPIGYDSLTFTTTPDNHIRRGDQSSH